MSELHYDLTYLKNPEIFRVGRMDAYSDHDVYLTPEEASANATSLQQSLNGLWKFSYTENPADRPEGFWAEGYDVSAWNTIPVPGHIQLNGYGKPQYVNIQYPWDGHEKLTPPAIPEDYNPVGSYVRTFEVPASWLDMRVVLTFHGVETAFYCWVNGQFIGYSEDSFTPSHFDITAALKPGQNTVAVEVFRFSTATWLEDQDFWRFSGIMRDVTLNAFPAAHVHDLFVHADMDGSLKVDYKLDLPKDKPVTLEMKLLAACGCVVDSVSVPAEAEMTVERSIENVNLWSAEDPYLYTLEVLLKKPCGCVIEVARTRVGFRRFELKDGLMLINGKRIIFNGADRHEFCMEGGRTVSYQDMLTDIRAIKRNNINAIRTSHYPNSSIWYKLCDEYGIYLIDETNLETHGTWHLGTGLETAVPGNRPEWLGAVLDRAQSMLERDKNHPSVIIWSCGNESFGGSDIYEMSQFFRRRDPSRLVHYEGISWDRRYNDSSDMESQMYTTVAGIEKFLAEHPEKPFILCEYTHAMGNSCGGMFKYIDLEYREPRYQGGFIWDFVDQAILTTAPNGKTRLAYGGDFGERPCDRDFCGNGLLFADRTETPRLQEVKYLYQPIRITPDAKGVTLENRNLFVNASRWNLIWQLNRDGVCVQSGEIKKPDVPAGETRRFDLPVAACELPGEYVLHVGLVLPADCDWAQAGYELMHGEAIIANIAKPEVPANGEYVVTMGDLNTGARDEAFEVLFRHTEGGITSLHAHDDLERLATTPLLSLYRAPTNNDIGNDDWRTEGIWLAASQLARFVPVSAERENGLLVVRYEVKMPVVNDSMQLAYTVLGNGRVKVELSWNGNASLPDLEAFGLSFRLPVEINHVDYYGFGPLENYSDRKHGAKLGRFHYEAEDNVTPYLQPQECGSREGVREITVTDDFGSGLRVEMVDAPLAVSVLPYSVYELMNARHQDELADPNYTYLDVALCRKGIGGDDSWQAPVHPEFHLPAGEARKLTFILSVVK